MKLITTLVILASLTACGPRRYVVCAANPLTRHAVCGAPSGEIDARVKAKLVAAMDPENELLIWVQRANRETRRLRARKATTRHATVEQ